MTIAGRPPGSLFWVAVSEARALRRLAPEPTLFRWGMTVPRSGLIALAVR